MFNSWNDWKQWNWLRWTCLNLQLVWQEVQYVSIRFNMYNSHQESIHHYRDQVAMVCPSLFISQQLCSDREIRCLELNSFPFVGVAPVHSPKNGGSQPPLRTQALWYGLAMEAEMRSGPWHPGGLIWFAIVPHSITFHHVPSRSYMVHSTKPGPQHFAARQCRWPYFFVVSSCSIATFLSSQPFLWPAHIRPTCPRFDKQKPSNQNFDQRGWLDNLVQQAIYRSHTTWPLLGHEGWGGSPHGPRSKSSTRMYYVLFELYRAVNTRTKSGHQKSPCTAA